jgi:hypothetical protein
MLGQFPDWFELDGRVRVELFFIGELFVDGVVAAGVDEVPLAALAMAVAPPATAPARDRVTSAVLSRLRIRSPPFLLLVGVLNWTRPG